MPIMPGQLQQVTNRDCVHGSSLCFSEKSTVFLSRKLVQGTFAVYCTSPRLSHQDECGCPLCEEHVYGKERGQIQTNNVFKLITHKLQICSLNRSICRGRDTTNAQGSQSEILLLAADCCTCCSISVVDEPEHLESKTHQMPPLGSFPLSVALEEMVPATVDAKAWLHQGEGCEKSESFFL